MWLVVVLGWTTEKSERAKGCTDVDIGWRKDTSAAWDDGADPGTQTGRKRGKAPADVFSLLPVPLQVWRKLGFVSISPTVPCLRPEPHPHGSLEMLGNKLMSFCQRLRGLNHEPQQLLNPFCSPATKAKSSFLRWWPHGPQQLAAIHHVLPPLITQNGCIDTCLGYSSDGHICTENPLLQGKYNLEGYPF